MSYENIQHPDKHEFGDSERKMLIMTRHELAYMTQKYDRVCADLRSIIDRVSEGKPVYVVMPNGDQLHLTKEERP